MKYNNIDRDDDYNYNDCSEILYIYENIFKLCSNQHIGDNLLNRSFKVENCISKNSDLLNRKTITFSRKNNNDVIPNNVLNLCNILIKIV